MAEVAVSQIVESVWRRQSLWSQAADAAKASIERSRRLALALTVAVAVLGTAAGQFAAHAGDWPRVLAFAAALAVGLAALASQGATSLHAWVRARAVSESIKALVYAYLAGVAPFRGADAQAVLLDQVERIVADAADLAEMTAGLEAGDRELPAVRDVASYARVRVADQVDTYYRPRASRMRRHLQAVDQVCLSLNVLSAALAAFTVAYAVAAPAAWIGVSTTVGIAVTANAAQSRYEYQQLAFTRTANELELLLARRGLSPAPDEAADDEFVRRCEAVISAQNSAWTAKWSVDPR